MAVQVSKQVAVARLVGDGFIEVAVDLDAWRNRVGDNKGWDGWFRGTYPELISLVWYV